MSERTDGLHFSANLSLLFAEMPFLDRFEAAAHAGFDAVEFMFPYAYPTTDIKQRLDAHGLALDLFNLPAGRFEAGERGVAVDPRRQAEFREGVELALSVAAELGVSKLNCLVGNLPSRTSVRRAHECLVDNLRWAAPRFAQKDRTLMIELLNPVDAPSFFLRGIDVAERVLADVDSSHVRFQFDVYHVQRTQGELVPTIRRLSDRIGHVQIADPPGRGQPGTGEINFSTVFKEIRAVYSGRIGLEYKPIGPTEDSFDWMEPYGWPLQGQGRSDD